MKPPLIICMNRLLPVAAATAIADHYNDNVEMRVLWRKQKSTWMALATPEALSNRLVYVLGVPHQFRDDGTDDHINDLLAAIRDYAMQSMVITTDRGYLRSIEKEWGYVPNPTPGWHVLKGYQDAYLEYLANTGNATKGMPPHMVYLRDNKALAGLLTYPLDVRHMRLFLRANALGMESYIVRGEMATHYKQNQMLLG